MPVPPALQRDIEVILGRVNALHAFCIVMAEALPNETLAVAGKAMKAAFSKVEADALASPISENTLQEMLRVMAELQMILQTNSTIPPDDAHQH